MPCCAAVSICSRGAQILHQRKGMQKTMEKFPAGGAGSSPLLSSRPRGNSSHLEGGSPTRLGTSRTHGDLGLQHWTTSRSVRFKTRLHRGFNCFILIFLNKFQQFPPQLLACTAEAEGLKMKSRLSLAASALLALLALVLLSSSQAQDQGKASSLSFSSSSHLISSSSHLLSASNSKV
ncbi:hypothetical protein AMECASPLE_025782 [Ameca splendens]|uniref:Uncharacterized protein n=1 Tax=Ameca splendens TaxID=208324 RepID=A0ABV0YH11_9TELE